MTASVPLNDAVRAYLQHHSVVESPLLKELRDITAELPTARLLLAPEQGQFLAVLTRSIGVRRYLEFGVFTGYSSLCVGMNMPPDGVIVALEKNAEWAEIAQGYWAKAGLLNHVDLRLGRALDSVADLKAEGMSGSFDLIFIDADRVHYPDYYEAAVALARPGGVIVIDDVFWHGQVADPCVSDVDTETMRRFNDLVASDTRVMSVMLPIGDGMTLAWKRP